MYVHTQEKTTLAALETETEPNPNPNPNLNLEQRAMLFRIRVKSIFTRRWSKKNDRHICMISKLTWIVYPKNEPEHIGFSISVCESPYD